MTEVVSFGAEVVVNYIENYGNTVFVAGVDEFFEAFGATVGVLDGVGIYAVVSSVSFARELGYWHYFDGVDSQFFKLFELGNYCFKCSGFCECADVQFVNNHFG